MPLPGLFPAIEPFELRMVAVDARHTLRVERSGNPDGMPVLFLHGGPGFPWSSANRRFCDPAHYQFIAFDQRGAWRSTPLGACDDNTTAHHIADIEELRRLFEVERWIVFGGSWGSALALAYAEAHPERCAALILWGIYLGHAEENDWCYRHSRWVLPEAWEALAAPIPLEERHDLLRAYARRIDDADPEVHEPALHAWLLHNLACSNYRHVPEELRREALGGPALLAAARICIPYFLNDIWLPRRSLLEGAGRLAGIPGWLAHGRSDYVCPIANARDLARAWPDARYLPVEDAGHSPFEPGIAAALLAAFEECRALR